MWKKRLKILLWCLLGCTCMVLLVAAMQAKDRKTCSDVKIDLEETGENVFVDTVEIALVLQQNNAVKGVEMENIPMALIEKELEKNKWVRDAQLFFDNNQLLTVKIAERQPLARVFRQGGKSFYIDTAANVLPLSERHTARVPVFTSFPAGKDTLSSKDSMVLLDVKNIARYIQQDSFWMAQVAQVDITPQHTYEIIPVLGDQVINLGAGDGLDDKFKKLFAFYKQVWGKTGFEKYARIDLQYEGQVVAVKRGVGLPVTDSLGNEINGGTATDSLNLATGTNAHAMAARDSASRGSGHHRAGLHTLPAKAGQKPTKSNVHGKPVAKPGKNNKPAKAVGARRDLNRR